MKKLSILLTIVLLLAVFGKVEHVKASGAYYTYSEVSDGQGTTRKTWFKDGEEIQGNPSTIEEESQITITTTPDEACAEYLETFYEPTVRVTVESGATVTFGSLESATSIQWLACYDSNVTVYAEGGDFQEDGSLPGSVYGLTCVNSTINFNGNVQYLSLGEEYKCDSATKIDGNLVVNGNVYNISFYVTSEYTQGDNGTEYYKGFKGDATVTGKVGSVYVNEIRHSNILGADIKATVAEGYGLSTFEVVDGVLSDGTKENIHDIEVDVENFYWEYSPLSDGTWIAGARYPSGGETGFGKVVTDEEISAILESGIGRVVLANDENVRADIGSYNLSELKVYRGGISVNNVKAADGNGNGLLMVHSYGREFINVNVNDEVDWLQINFTRANENMNINVNGKVNRGEVFKWTLQSDFPIYLGEFTCEDMEIYKDGVWNPDLFLKLGTTEYHPVDDAVLDDALGLEKNIQNGSETISQMADMFVEEVESGTLDELENDDDFNACIEEYEDAEVLTGVEIELQKYDYNETTGEVSNQEVVTELGNKDISITVKVPEHKYKKGKKYIIVREHDNHGKREMNVLEPKQEGDRLTFKTNKFSSFIIVEVTEDFSDYTGMIKVGGEWYYYIDGAIASDYTGLAQNEYGWWYIKDGKLDLTYTGLVKYKSNWVYVTKGKLNASYTGLVKYKSNWVYVSKGKLNTSYTGLVKYKSNWVYVSKGKLDAAYTGMAKNQYGWWYVKAGKLDLTYTGMARNQYGWWYIKDGKLDLTYTGLAKNQYGWWHITNGKLDLTYTGISANQYGNWYVKNGKLDLTYTGKLEFNGITYNIKAGKVV